jgi:hypothetical protein
MSENVFAPNTAAQAEPQAEPALRRNLKLPQGVLQKNLKTLVYLGAVSLVILAAFFSSAGKKTLDNRTQPRASLRNQQCRTTPTATYRS